MGQRAKLKDGEGRSVVVGAAFARVTSNVVKTQTFQWLRGRWALDESPSDPKLQSTYPSTFE